MTHRPVPPVDVGLRLPRLVATDLDGTLLGAGAAVSERSAVMLRRTAAAGALVLLVTGRSPLRLSAVYAQLGALYPAVCCNGAVVYDPVSDVVRLCHPMAAARVREVCMRLRRAVPQVIFAGHVDGGRRLLHQPDWPVHREVADVAYQVGWEELAGEPVVKLQARAPGHDPEEFVRLVAERVGDLVEVTRQGYRGLVEMSQAGVTKASALAAVALEHAIAAEDALVFGDMPNDVSMLRWAGRSVAVANAHPEALAAAKETTVSNVDDGVALYLERLLDSVP